MPADQEGRPPVFRSDADGSDPWDFAFDAETRRNLERLLPPERRETFIHLAEEAVSNYRFRIAVPLEDRHWAQDQLQRLERHTRGLADTLDKLTPYAAALLNDGAVATGRAETPTAGRSPVFTQARRENIAKEQATRRGLPSGKEIPLTGGLQTFTTRARDAANQLNEAAAWACDRLHPGKSGPAVGGPEYWLVIDLADAFKGCFGRPLSSADRSVFARIIRAVFKGAGIDSKVSRTKLSNILKDRVDG